MPPMDTVAEVVDALTAEGFRHDFAVRDGQVCCPDCGACVDPEDVVVDRIERFEGASDPDDEAMVIAVSEGPCGHAGTLALAFGPDAPPEEGEVVRRLPR